MAKRSHSWTQLAPPLLSPPLTAAVTWLQTHLSEVQVHEAEREELQADRAAVQQPEGEGSQGVRRHKVPEVEGEEDGAQRRPQQAQEQEHGLVAEPLVSVPQHQPQLHVDEGEEEGVEDGVDHRQAQGDVGGHGRAQGGQKRERGVLLPLRRGLHDSLPPGRRALTDAVLRWRRGGRIRAVSAAVVRLPAEEPESARGT